MTKPKAVVFDLGKVLLDFDYGIAIRRIVPSAAISEAATQRLINQSPLLHEYETGLITTSEFFDRVKAASGFRGGLEEFVGSFADIFSEIPRMVELHQHLRRNQVPTYVFSNTNDLAIRHIRERFPFFSRFDGYILSYEQRCMKPAAPLYEALEKLAGLRGPDLAYLDDRLENVEAALARGWHAHLHQTPEGSWDYIRQAGL